MNNNIKKLFLLTTVLMLLVTVSAAVAADDSDSNVISEQPVANNAATSDSDNAVVDNNKIIDKTNDNKVVKKDPTTHIVNNDSVDDIFSGEGYTLGENIAEGDTLDFQGIVDRNHSIVINKPINVISSTEDAFISLHTVGGSLMGENPGNRFTVNNGASGCNVSGLYLYNTQCWIYNVYNGYFSNMTMFVQNASVGSGVGQTSVRFCDNVTFDGCNIYTENNGGSSSFVWTFTSNSTIKNSIIEGKDNVGNLLYIGNPYNYNDIPEGFEKLSLYNRVENCTVKTNRAGGTCIPIQNMASFTTIDGVKAYALGSSIGSGTNGTLINCETYQACGISVGAGSTAYNNTVMGNGSTSIAANSTVYNNTFNKVTLSAANIAFENNIVNDNLTVSQPCNIQNNNLSAVTFSTNSKNSNLTNNNITGLVTVNAVNVTIKDNLINTTSEVAVTVTTDNVTIVNNTIFAIGKAGNDAIKTTKTTTVIEENQPTAGEFNITDETYSQFFDENGLLINPAVGGYATLILQGTFNNKSFILTNVSVVIKGEDAVLNNGQIVVDDQATAVIENITFNNTNIDSSVIFNTDDNILRNSKIIKTFTDAKAREVYITGNKNKVEYNSIEITGPSTPVNYGIYPNLSPVIAIAVLSSSNTVQYNNVTYTDTDNNMNGSSDLITVSGVLGEAQNNLVTRNNLKAIGSGYLYGLNLGVNANNNNLTYNTLNITSSFYTYGVSILQVPMVNDRILYNTMYLKADNTTYGVLANIWGEPEASIFAINNNNINVEAINAYGAQIAGSPWSNIVFKNVNFTTNTINVNGKYAMGIGLYMTDNVILNRNTLNITGQTNETNTASWDSVKPRTVGVYSENSNITRLSNEVIYTVVNGPNVIFKDVNNSQINNGAFASNNTNFVLENVENTNVTGTKANTTTKTAVDLINSNNNIIRNNVFIGDDIGGDDAVICDENSQENIIELNTPMNKLLTEDTYASLFDENGIYLNNRYNTLQLGSDLYNKDLKFTDGISLVNTGDYTIYNGTIYYMDTEDAYKTAGINITGINFNNENKSVIVDQLTTTQKRSIYFYYNNVTVTGDDVIVFDSQKDVVTNVYFNAQYNKITVDATNVDIAKMIRPVNTDLNDYVDFEYNNVTINAQEDASVVTVVGSETDFIANNVNITAKNVIVVSNINGSAYNFFYSDNNIIASGDNVTALILINNGGSNPSIGRNVFNLTSENPVTAIYSEGSVNVFVGLGRTTTSSNNRPNQFYINATNGETPVIIATGQNNSVRNNTILTNDIYGDNAVEAAVVSNNRPFVTDIIITAPQTVKIGDVITITAQSVNKTGKAVTGNLVMKVNGEVVAESTESSISYTFTIEEANTTVLVEFTNTTTAYGPCSKEIELLDTQATIVEVDDIQATAGENMSISATFKDVYGNNINGGKAIVKINGVTLKDENGKVIYVKVVDGVAQFDNIEIPEKWAGKTLDIQVVYSGTTKHDSMRYNTTVTVESQESSMEFTTKDITAHRKDTIELSVKVNAQDGKVVFKVNGKTVKDENGKVVYAKVVNGMATVNYTVPNTFKYQTYNVTATYIYKDERLEANTTLTIVE